MGRANAIGDTRIRYGPHECDMQYVNTLRAMSNCKVAFLATIQDTHTHIHTYTHYTHTHTHIYKHTYTHTYTYTHNTHIHTYTHRHIIHTSYTHIHTRTHYTHLRTHTHHTYTHIQTHTHPVALYPGLLTPAFVTFSTNVVEGLVQLSHVV